MACDRDVLRPANRWFRRRKQHKRKSCGRTISDSVANLQLPWSYELNASHSPHFLSATLRKKNHVNINPAAMPFKSAVMRIDRSSSGGDGHAPLALRRPEKDKSPGVYARAWVSSRIWSGSRLFTISGSSLRISATNTYGKAFGCLYE